MLRLFLMTFILGRVWCKVDLPDEGAYKRLPNSDGTICFGIPRPGYIIYPCVHINEQCQCKRPFKILLLGSFGQGCSEACKHEEVTCIFDEEFRKLKPFLRLESLKFLGNKRIGNINCDTSNLEIQNSTYPWEPAIFRNDSTCRGWRNADPSCDAESKWAARLCQCSVPGNEPHLEDEQTLYIAGGVAGAILFTLIISSIAYIVYCTRKQATDEELALTETVQAVSTIQSLVETPALVRAGRRSFGSHGPRAFRTIAEFLNIVNQLGHHLGENELMLSTERCAVEVRKEWDKIQAAKLGEVCYLSKCKHPERPLLRSTAVVPPDRTKHRKIAQINPMHMNFVSGLDGRRRFILSQAPLEAEMENFLRIVVREKIGVIFVPASLVDLEWKIFDYFSLVVIGAPVQYGLATLDCLRDIVEDSSHSVRLFRTSVRDEESSLPEVQEFLHIFYKLWADFGTANETAHLIKLKHIKDEIMAYQIINHRNKFLIHCSAGLGRSGTLLAFFLATEWIHRYGWPLNICAIVKHIRRQRPEAVQNIMQYAFLYSAILDESKRTKTIHDKWDDQKSKSTPRSGTPFARLFSRNNSQTQKINMSEPRIIVSKSPHLVEPTEKQCTSAVQANLSRPSQVTEDTTKVH